MRSHHTLDAQTESSSLIRLQHVSKHYPGSSGDVFALEDVSFSIRAGELVFLTGHSGAGKSTLLRLIAAMERPSEGSLQVAGQDLGQMPAAAIPFLRRKLGLVFQDQKLLEDRCALDNVMLPLQVTGHAHADALRRAHTALQRVGLSDRASASPRSLSGGERQRLCMARAVVNHPVMLLADEPTVGLDANAAQDIMALLLDFHQHGTTVLVATHDQHLMHGLMAHHPARRLTLQRGRLLTSSGPQDL
jgi:cell division transport system ATP-binding protein